MSDKEKPNLGVSSKAFFIIALCSIIPTVTTGYILDRYLQSFWVTTLIIIPIMGVCLGVYSHFSKQHLTIIEVLVLMSIAAMILSIVCPARLACLK